MPDNTIKNPLHSVLLGFQAGILGGIKAGALETLLIARFGAAPANLSGFLFAIVAYGIMGGIIGVLLSLVLGILPLHQEKRKDRRLLGVFIFSLTLATLLFLIFVFRAFRDFHAERVRYVEPTGLLTILVLLILAGFVFFLTQLLSNKVFKWWFSWIFKPGWYLVQLGVVLLLGIILQAAFSKETEEVRAEFTPTQNAPAVEQPVVILIMVDTLRPDFLAFQGKEQITTPNIDEFAKQATIFQTTYAQATHTKPSTASLLSSRYPSEHRAIHKTDAVPNNIEMLAEIFSKAGYYCGGIVTNINLAPVYNFQQGFHHYIYLPPKFLFGANEAASRLVIYGVLRLVRMKLVKSIYVHHFYRSGETVTVYVSDFFDQQKDQKFFLFLHYMDPHDPYFEHPYNGMGYARVALPNPDASFAEPFRRLYREDVEYLDHWFGQVMKNLKDLGIYDSSLIVLTADHGEEFYEHGGWWHGTTLHEEQVRVPLLIKRPAQQDSGVVIETLTRSIDIAPTILSITGLDRPAEMRGRDLFSAELDTVEPYIFSETDHEGNIVQMLRVGPWKYIKTNPDNPRKRPAEQLFYIPDDPHEKQNVADQYVERVVEMRALLEAEYADILATQTEASQQSMDRATEERLRALGYTK
ncbi:MAG: sulfatase [bacterium]